MTAETKRLCIVLNKHNTVFDRSGPLYATDVSLGPPESSTQTASRSLQPFLPDSLGDRPTDRLTDYAIRSVTIGGAHNRDAKLCYCLRLPLVFIGAVDSTRSDQLKQSSAIFSCRPKTRQITVYVETHYNIASTRAFSTGVLGRWHNYLLIYWRTSCLIPAFDDT